MKIPTEQKTFYFSSSRPRSYTQILICQYYYSVVHTERLNTSIFKDILKDHFQRQGKDTDP